jgi:hypothetical protein
MSLSLVKPDVEKLTNAEIWLEIVTIVQNSDAERRQALAKLLDEHFIIYTRGARP